MELSALLTKLNFASCIQTAISQKILKDEKRIASIASTAYDGVDFDFPLCKRMPLTRLAVVTFLLLSQYDAYRAKLIPDKIIFDTFDDVSLRARLYYEKTGRPGLSKEDVIWFRHIMHVNIFKIGALQFQPFEMVYLDKETLGEAYMQFSEQQKRRLPSGAPVINCHIQRGANLGKQAVEQSLKEARSFFKTHFSAIRFEYFLCYSWLLYPPMTQHLPEGSNIRYFASQFTIISSCGDTAQAMENLFENGRRAELPHPTSLQKMALEHPERLGYACGIRSISSGS